VQGLDVLNGAPALCPACVDKSEKTKVWWGFFSTEAGQHKRDAQQGDLTSWICG